MNVKDLWKLCTYEIGKGNGNKEVWLSNDDEGNGYHKCSYEFTEDVEGNNMYGQFKKGDNKKKIILG